MKATFEKNDLEVRVLRRKGMREFLPMFHGHAELIYVVKGEFTARVDGKMKTLSEGQMCVTFPYVVHGYEKSEDAEVIVVLFAPSMVEAFQKELNSQKPETPFIENAAQLLPVFDKLSLYYLKDRRMVQAYLTVLLGEVIRLTKCTKTEQTAMTSIQEILSYCTDHYRENISIKKVASALYLSESYISKVFAGKLGCSFRSYINNLRVREAAKLLRTTGDTIVDIMYATGFENQSSFNRIFSAEMGCTPREYRKRNS